MKKYFYIFIAFILLSMNIFSQTLSPFVLTSQGGSASAGGNQLNWTVGSQLTETYSVNGTPKLILTQGFEQPELQVWTGAVNMPLCGTGTVIVNYTASGIISSSNVFTAELSNANGSFSNPIILGTVTTNINGTITGNIPASTPSGTGYRVRVKSSSPQFIGLDNGTNLQINKIGVTIPDAYALVNNPAAVKANTVYTGYAPAASITLSASITNGQAPYTYEWKANGSNKVLSTNATLSTSSAGTYTVTVTNVGGCNVTASKVINVIDVACGSNKNPMVVVCINGTQNCVPARQADGLLTPSLANSGNTLGVCGAAGLIASTGTVAIAPGNNKALPYILNLRIAPNPTTYLFTFKVESSNSKEPITLRVINSVGRVMDVKTNLVGGQIIQMGNNYNTGSYFVEIIQGKNSKQMKLIKLEK